MQHPTSALIFLPVLFLYFSSRIYWAGKANKRPVRANKTFVLDQVNIALVGLFSVIAPPVAIFTHLLDRFNFHENRILQLLSIPFLYGGLVTFWISHRDLGENWSVTLKLKEGHALVTHGIFKTIRHPMYLSIWLGTIGQALCIPNFIAGVGGLLTWAALYFVRIEKEEQMMLEKFGDEYRRYKERTHRIFPFV